MTQYLFIFCMALAAACGGGEGSKKEEIVDSSALKLAEQKAETANGRAVDISTHSSAGDTLFRASGNEPFWGIVVAKSGIVFTSMEGDTLTFRYTEPRKAAGRPAEYLQIFELDKEQKLIFKQANDCPCSDGMSNREYPYYVTLILKERILEGCGQKPTL